MVLLSDRSVQKQKCEYKYNFEKSIFKRNNICEHNSDIIDKIVYFSSLLERIWFYKRIKQNFSPLDIFFA